MAVLIRPVFRAFVYCVCFAFLLSGAAAPMSAIAFAVSLITSIGMDSCTAKGACSIFIQIKVDAVVALAGWRFLCVCAFDGFLLWFRIAYACPATASLCNM